MVKRILKVLLFVVLSLIILLGLITLLLPSGGRVVRGDTIPARPAVVFDQLNNLRTYVNWNPWFLSGPAWETDFSRPAAGAGAFYTWQHTGKTEGRGKFVITESRPDSLLAFHLELGKLPPMEGRYELLPADSGRATRIRWTLTMDAGWKPWWRFWAGTMDRLMGPAMESGLVNLKVVSRQYDQLSDIPLRQDTLSQQYVATIPDTCEQQQIFSRVASSLDEIRRFMAAVHVKAAGGPMAQFHVLPDGRYRVNAGIPLEHEVAPQRRVAVLRRPACKVVMADYEGPYGGISRVYQVLSKYKSLHAQNSPAPAWEVYPDKLPQSDTTVCRVTVYCPVY